MIFSPALGELIAELERLPGLGPKSAQRLAYYLLRQSDEQVFKLSDAIRKAKVTLKFCTKCQNITEHELCEICSDHRRDRTIICVVAEARDIATFERLRDYKGLYHVLHGLLNPLEGIGPDQLRVRELLDRVNHGVIEIIVATNPTIEGEATALYLARLLKPLELKITRLAHGIPIGGDLDYTDAATLMSALENRREL